MLVRKPEILGSKPDDVIWSVEPEVALVFNAMSAVIPHVEHYLNNVIAEVRRNHCGDDPELARVLDDFIGQETEHSRLHMLFNRWLFEAGYEDLKPILKSVIEDYRKLRSEKASVQFHAAYCAGFENSATFSAKYILGPGLKHFRGASSAGANLILWHVAEEFEHRAVCHDAFNKVSGNYFLRIWGLLYAFWHIMSAFKRAADVMFRVYRKDMTKAEKKASNRRLRKFLLGMFGYMLPRMLVLFSPGFDPSKMKVSDDIQDALDYFTAQGPISKNFSDHQSTDKPLAAA